MSAMARRRSAVELRRRGARCGIRTRATCVESAASWAPRRTEQVWTVRESNPRPPACHAGALPTAPTARCWFSEVCCHYTRPVTAGVPSRGDRLGLIGAVGGTGLRNRTAPLLVGIAGFEPATSATRKQRAPKLRHIPLRSKPIAHVRAEPGTGIEPATIRLQGGRSAN